ncbi:CsxC family protein [Solibacillus sp. FSL W7-1436]|uniref:CsxC family protein n=1 Tax=Solibacillus sp. FSL W7-1436 TaxID=2921705 RepID=UPI0030F559B6
MNDGYSKQAKNCKPGEDTGVKSNQQIPVTDSDVTLVPSPLTTPTFKIPVVLAERTLQIVVESDISLYPPATEIKRVKKHVFLDQVKLVPVAFAPITDATTGLPTGYFTVTRAKLFVGGHIRKNIEYASADYNAPLQDRIANVRFTGFAELTADDFFNLPIFGFSANSEANFLNEKTEMDARLDKYFFQNLVRYNEQPYGELVAANFYELDFSPNGTYHDGSFHMLREKIVLDLTLKVLQIQQVNVGAGGALTSVVPNNLGITPEG